MLTCCFINKILRMRFLIRGVKAEVADLLPAAIPIKKSILIQLKFKLISIACQIFNLNRLRILIKSIIVISY